MKSLKQVILETIQESVAPMTRQTRKDMKTSGMKIVVKSNKELIKIINESPVDADLNHLDVSGITDMGGLFSNSKFNGDISKWDVSSVEKMNGMFMYSQFNGDISEWDVSNVKNMRDIFKDSPLESKYGTNGEKLKQ